MQLTVKGCHCGLQPRNTWLESNPGAFQLCDMHFNHKLYGKYLFFHHHP